MRNDTVREMVDVALMTVTFVIMVRMILGPDGTRILVMKGARGVERLAMVQAEGWANLADRASRVYDSARQVSV